LYCAPSRYMMMYFEVYCILYLLSILLYIININIRLFEKKHTQTELSHRHQLQ